MAMWLPAPDSACVCPQRASVTLLGCNQTAWTLVKVCVPLHMCVSDLLQMNYRWSNNESYQHLRIQSNFSEFVSEACLLSLFRGLLMMIRDIYGTLIPHCCIWE